MSTPTTATEVVPIGTRAFAYSRPWDGRSLTARGYLAPDTATEALDDDRAIPRLALASACAGGAAGCLIHPDQVGVFILAHPRARLVFHKCAFDFWVIDRHLRERGEEKARKAWWEACDRDRMADAMLLDHLIELARRDAARRPRDLAAAGRPRRRLDPGPRGRDPGRRRRPRVDQPGLRQAGRSPPDRRLPPRARGARPCWSSTRSLPLISPSRRLPGW